MADHQWEDDALRSNGRAWIAGQVFVCGVCGLRRVMIHKCGSHGEKLEERESLYLQGGKRVKGRMPECIQK